MRAYLEMNTSVQLISKRLVEFPTNCVGREGTQVWLLAYAGQVLKNDCTYVPLDITTQLLFPAHRFIGLDLTWEQHQKRYTELLDCVETDPTLRTNYLTAYELAAVDTGRPYLSMSTITHPQLTRPLMMAPHLYGAFLIGITPVSYADWHCTTRDLTEHGYAFYERVKQILPSTVLGLLTLLGTQPLVPLVLKSDTDNA
jgi:hypothetical protein